MDRKSSNEPLESSLQPTVDDLRSRLAAIVESSDDAIIGKNLKGIVTSWNQAACRLFAYTAEEMIGQPILKIIPPDLHAEEADIISKIKAGIRIDHYETQRVRKDGDLVHVSLTISPVKDSEGRIVGSSKIARDISARKEMERIMIQSERLAATGRMAATLAHEINNPLDSVINLLYLARQSITDQKVLAYLTTAERELDRVARIARRTMGFYRDPAEPTELRLESLFEDVLSIYRSRLIAANIAVDCAFGHRNPIAGSRDDLTHVFSSLVANALDAMADGGVLTVETRETPGENIEIVIRDRGTGISAEHLPRVFEPFFSTKASLSAGMGLWASRQLITRRGGSIQITSSTEPPRNGTTVTVVLPFKT